MFHVLTFDNTLKPHFGHIGPTTRKQFFPKKMSFGSILSLCATVTLCTVCQFFIGPLFAPLALETSIQDVLHTQKKSFRSTLRLQYKKSEKSHVLIFIRLKKPHCRHVLGPFAP